MLAKPPWTLGKHGPELISKTSNTPMKKILLSVLFVFAVVYAFAQCPNLITNGDFEAGNAGFTSQYAYVAPPLNPTSLYWEGLYAITSNPRNVHTAFASLEDHTSGNGSMMMVTNGSVQSNVMLWSQSVAVKPGTEYTLEAWGIGVVKAYPAKLKFFINDVQVGNTFTVGIGVWTQFASNWNSGTATTAHIAIINESTEAGGNDFALDDVAFRIASVPTVSVADVSNFNHSNTIYLGYGPQSLNYTAVAAGGQPPYSYQVGDAAFSTSPSFSMSNAGAYSINVKDANNCISINSATLNIAVKDVRCGNNNNKVLVCHNTSSANNPDNAICISPNAVPAHLAHGDALGDCAPSTARMIHPDQPNIPIGISLFPNPAHGQITVTFKDAGNIYNGYQIIDITGRVVLSKGLGEGSTSGSITIDISHFSPGIYMMRALGDEGLSISKFTVE
jgi:hypothetical protein